MTQPVKWFASDMAGAPSCTGQVGQIIAVLDACLVNGFNLLTLDSLVVASNVATGTKANHGYKVNQIVVIAGASPAGLNGEWRVTWVTTNTFTFATTGISNQTATGTITSKTVSAGWLKEFSGTNLAAYKSQDSNASACRLRVDDTVALYASVVGYETMSDINTGTNSFATHYFKKSSTADATARAWVLVSDSRGFYLGIAWSGTTTYDFYHFGDFNTLVSGDIYNCRLQGLNTSAPSTIGGGASVSNAHPGTTVNISAGLCPRTYAAVYGPVSLFQASMSGALECRLDAAQTNYHAYNFSGNHGYYNTNNTEPYQAPNPGDGGIHFFPVFLIETVSGPQKMLRGSARGLLHIFESSPTVSGNYQLLSGAVDVNGGLVLIIRSAGHGLGSVYPASTLAFELGDWG